MAAVSLRRGSTTTIWPPRLRSALARPRKSVTVHMLPLLAIGLWPMGYLRIVSGWFERKLGLALGIANAGIGIG